MRKNLLLLAKNELRNLSNNNNNDKFNIKNDTAEKFDNKVSDNG